MHVLQGIIGVHSTGSSPQLFNLVRTHYAFEKMEAQTDTDAATRSFGSLGPNALVLWAVL